jgi:hypothetical protein
LNVERLLERTGCLKIPEPLNWLFQRDGCRIENTHKNLNVSSEVAFVVLNGQPATIEHRNLTYRDYPEKDRFDLNMVLRGAISACLNCLGTCAKRS